MPHPHAASILHLTENGQFHNEGVWKRSKVTLKSGTLHAPLQPPFKDYHMHVKFYPYTAFSTFASIESFMVYQHEAEKRVIKMTVGLRKGDEKTVIMR